jgi:hypothetical protein
MIFCLLDAFYSINNSNRASAAYQNLSQAPLPIQADIETNKKWYLYIYKDHPHFRLSELLTPPLSALIETVMFNLPGHNMALPEATTPKELGEYLTSIHSVAEHEPVFFDETLTSFHKKVALDYDDSSIQAFDFLCRIETTLNRVLKSPSIEFRGNRFSKQFLSLVFHHVHSRGLSEFYPITQEKPLCSDQNEFRRLGLLETKKLFHLQKEHGIIPKSAEELKIERALIAARITEELLEEAKALKIGKKYQVTFLSQAPFKKKAPEKATHEMPSGAGAGAGAGGAAACMLKSSSASSVVSFAEAEEAASITSTLEIISSLKQTLKSLRSTLFFHPRVAAWKTSAQRGLLYYKFDARTSAISKEEMILRHRLPHELLMALYNPYYSIRGTWMHEGIALRRQTANISIDGSPYTLQATLNEKNELYHFYAEPASHVSSTTEEEFLKLQMEEAGIDTTPWELEGIDGVKLDDEKNMIIDFEGHTYKVFINN